MGVRSLIFSFWMLCCVYAYVHGTSAWSIYSALWLLFLIHTFRALLGYFYLWNLVSESNATEPTRGRKASILTISFGEVVKYSEQLSNSVHNYFQENESSCKREPRLRAQPVRGSNSKYSHSFCFNMQLYTRIRKINQWQVLKLESIRSVSIHVR